MGGWISGAKAAAIMGVHRNTVVASLRDAKRRAEWWGAEGEGWRYKPLSTRRIFEVRQERAQGIADGTWPPKPQSAEALPAEPSAPSTPEPEPPAAE